MQTEIPLLRTESDSLVMLMDDELDWYCAVSRIRSPGEVAVMSHGIGCSVCMYVVCPMFALY